MLLIDTSVWIDVFRDRSDQVRQQLRNAKDLPFIAQLIAVSLK